MRKKAGYRSWFYFRQGWTTYFAFIFAAVNTLTVTYYLAIENMPFVKDIFPSFTTYVILLVSVGIPLLTFIGYVHYRRTAAYASEAEISVEQNPYWYKAPPGFSKEVQWPLFLKFSEILVKISDNEKLSNEDLDDVKELQNKIKKLIRGEAVGTEKSRGIV